MQSRMTSVRQIDAFTDEVSRNVDAYLAGEREQEQGEVWDACADPADEWTAEQRAQYNEMLDQDDAEYWDRYLSRYCQLHDQELVNGKCAACEHEAEEERINDK